MTGKSYCLLSGLLAALLAVAVGVCDAALPKSGAAGGGNGPRQAEAAAAAATPAQPAVQPAPAVEMAAPAVTPVPQMPTAPAPARLMTTPRARLALHPRVTNPQAVVAGSGRMGCAFSFRSVLGGIIEYLFPGTGLFRRGESLFRIYDAGILADLSAAEKAMANYDVQPLLIMRAPRRVASAATGLPVEDVPNFPSPTARKKKVPLNAVTESETRAPARAPQTAAEEPPALEVNPAEDEPLEVEVIRGAQPAAPKAARLKPGVKIPQVDLGPFEKAVSEAEEALEAAQSRVRSCEEDYSAKQKLVELGALPAGKAEESAAALSAAGMEAADAKARIGVARERLADARTRAEQAATMAARAAEEQAAAEVEVIRGDAEAPGPKKTRSGQGARIAKANSGVEVIRGSDTPAAQSDPPQPPSRDANEPPPIPGVAQSNQTRRPQLTSRTAPDTVPPMMTAGFPGTPKELDRLAEQRWTEFAAPNDGFVVERATQSGDQVQPGQELFRVINTQWARAFFTVGREDVERFAPGTVVTVTFDDYPSVAFEGWISSLAPEEGGDTARAEIVMFCRQGYFGTDAFGTLQWLALATPLDQSAEDTAPVRQVAQSAPEHEYHRDPLAQMSMVPQDIWELSVDPESLPRSEQLYEGHLQLADLCGPDDVSAAEGPQRQRLAKLLEWREGFVDGMTRTLFSERVVLTYPKSGEIRRAIERMATGRVSNVPNRCARTMREALGWGLGDAHVWARTLPTRGYVARRDGLARPGDILVWPFTYPPRNSQHIGVAVQQNGRLMLLSNLNGDLGTVDVRPGYIAFYKPGA